MRLSLGEVVEWPVTLDGDNALTVKVLVGTGDGVRVIRMTNVGKARGLRAYLAQIAMTDSTDASVARIEQALADAARKGCNVAVFPECATTGYRRGMIEDMEQPAKVEGALQQVADACKRHRIAAVVGTLLRERGVWYDGAVVFDANGAALTRQGKTALNSPEATFLKPWTKRSTFDLFGPKCGILFCREAAEPQVWPEVALTGCDVIFWLAYYMPIRTDDAGKEVGNHCIEQGTTLAKEFGAYVLQANWATWVDAPQVRVGSTVAVSPEGTLLAHGRLGEEEALVVTIAP